MMSTKRLCILIIVVCLITPLGVGFMLPQSTEKVITYETGNTASITSDIRNNTEDYTVDYYGETNNSLWEMGGINSVARWDVTDNANSTPFYDYEAETGVSLWDYDYIDTSMAYFSGAGYVMSRGTAYDLTVTITLPDGSVTTASASRAYYIPATNFVHYRDGSVNGIYVYLGDGTKCKITTNDVSHTIYGLYKNSTTQWKDLQQGVTFNNLYYSTNWYNGYKNYGLVMNLIMEPGSQIELSLQGVLTLSRTAEGMTTYSITGGTTQNLGNYRYIAVQIDTEGATIYGLSEGRISDSPWDRIITSKHVDWTPEYYPDYTWPFMTMEVILRDTLDSDNNPTVRAYVYSATTVVGKYTVTIDKTIDMNNYYVDMDGFAMRFTNGTTVKAGAELVVCGVSLPVTDGGTITYGGIKHAITGMIITIVNDGNNQYANLNNIRIEGADPATWSSVTLQGNWGSIGVSISELSGHITDVFHWESGLFALSLQAYAGIGLAAAVGSFVLCAMIGRRSGEKVFWLMVVSGCCAAFYAVLLLGS